MSVSLSPSPPFCYFSTEGVKLISYDGVIGCIVTPLDEDRVSGMFGSLIRVTVWRSVHSGKTASKKEVTAAGSLLTAMEDLFWQLIARAAA